MNTTTYEQLLAASKDYVKVKAVDTPRTIFLVNKAKGNRSLRGFASASHTTAPSLSRVLNGITIEMGSKMIAGIVSGAEEFGIIDLDELMDAQGRQRKKNDIEIENTYNKDLRSILTDELLMAGYYLSFEKQKSYNNNVSSISEIKSVISLSEGITTEEYVRTFRIYAVPRLNGTGDLKEFIKEWKKTINKNRQQYSMVLDNPLVFQEIVNIINADVIQNIISVILVSPQKRKVVQEVINCSSSSVRNAKSMFTNCDKSGMNIKDYFYDKVNKESARCIISDELLQKGYNIRYASLPEYDETMLQPDFIISLNGRKSKQNNWAFAFKHFEDGSDYSESSKTIRDWLYRTFSFCYLGGKISRLSLVMDNESIYNDFIREVSKLRVRDPISAILISLKDRKVICEYNIPASNGKTTPNIF